MFICINTLPMYSSSHTYLDRLTRSTRSALSVYRFQRFHLTEHSCALRFPHPIRALFHSNALLPSGLQYLAIDRYHREPLDLLLTIPLLACELNFRPSSRALTSSPPALRHTATGSHTHPLHLQVSTKFKARRILEHVPQGTRRPLASAIPPLNIKEVVTLCLPKEQFGPSHSQHPTADILSLRPLQSMKSNGLMRAWLI